MNEARTVSKIVNLITAREPFVHVRFGDGDVFFMSGTGPTLTGDGEQFNPLLQNLLCKAWFDVAVAKSLVLLGDIGTYAVSDGCEGEWVGLLAAFKAVRVKVGQRACRMVHMEALRVGFGYALPAYQAIRDDTRRKVYVAPKSLAPMAQLLGCDWYEVPLQTAWEGAVLRADEVLSMKPQVVLFSAGRGGKIMQGEIAQINPAITQIDVGSGLDLLVDDGVRRGTDLRFDRRKVLNEYREAGLAP